ncbi:MAG: tRNA (cytidine(34)-2'-O)-methyltransferase [Defluviitaleaceae bacterium]|nr:tRNA (cytidine(34)-2'-O)-methyltransferase [Defluviitaleaceae bacterium]
MNIVLHEPEIPHNTGAIGRTCLITGSKLHLIHPFGFHLDEKSLKRSGLDYWSRLAPNEYANFNNFLANNPDARIFLAETKGAKFYTDAQYKPNDYIIFGNETMGLPQHIIDAYPERIITIPMTGEERSLNLSVSVAIILYEALRQTGFQGLQ